VIISTIIGRKTLGDLVAVETGHLDQEQGREEEDREG